MYRSFSEQKSSFSKRGTKISPSNSIIFLLNDVVYSCKNYRQFDILEKLNFMSRENCLTAASWKRGLTIADLIASIKHSKRLCKESEKFQFLQRRTLFRRPFQKSWKYRPSTAFLLPHATRQTEAVIIALRSSLDFKGEFLVTEETTTVSFPCMSMVPLIQVIQLARKNIITEKKIILLLSSRGFAYHFV